MGGTVFTSMEEECRNIYCPELSNVETRTYMYVHIRDEGESQRFRA